MDVPAKYVDKSLYRRVKLIIDKQYEKPSAYKSMALIKKYKDLGGKIDETLTKNNTKKWRDEKWKNLTYVVEGKGNIKEAPACGQRYPKQKGKSICRPTVKIDKSTPNLAQSYTKEQLKKAQQLKNKGKTINWSKL